MNSFLVICSLIGTTLIVARSTIFRPVQRLWPALFSCSQCLGVWVGVVAGASGVLTIGRGHVIDALIVGTANSFLSLSADAVLVALLGKAEEE